MHDESVLEPKFLLSQDSQVWVLTLGYSKENAICYPNKRILDILINIQK